MPVETIAGRMGLLVTMFLCTINTYNSVNTNSPKGGGNTTAIVEWILACLLFIIMAIVEYALILAHMKYQKMTMDDQTYEAATDSGNEKNAKIYRLLDMCMIIIFPLGFSAYSVLFWLYYINQATFNTKKQEC